MLSHLRVFLSLQLNVQDLQDTIKYMHDNKKYKKVRSDTPLCMSVYTLCQ